jgi:putative membrane protein
MLAFSAVTAVLAYVRWARVERAMRRQEPLPAFGLGLVITAGLVAVAVLLLVAFLP